MSRFTEGQSVTIALTTPNPFGGEAITTYEEGVVLSVEGDQVLLDNGSGNDPGGPFSDSTGERIESLPFCRMSITEFDPHLDYGDEDD